MSTELRLYAQAGMMVPRCPVVFRSKSGKERCTGHQYVPVRLDELAEIRNGINKVVTADFSCIHKTVDKLVIYV